MSFFDPANMFGGGGSRVRDPLGLFGGGRRQMSPAEVLQAQQGGGQSIRDGGRREMAFGGAAGPAGGQFEREYAEMSAPAPQPGGGSFGAISALGGAGGGPQFGGFSGGKPAPVQQGPNPAAMMQSQGGQPDWGGLASAMSRQRNGAQSGAQPGVRGYGIPGLMQGADAWDAKRGRRGWRGP